MGRRWRYRSTRPTPARFTARTHSSARSSASGTAKVAGKRSLVALGSTQRRPQSRFAVPSDVLGRSANKREEGVLLREGETSSSSALRIQISHALFIFVKDKRFVFVISYCQRHPALVKFVLKPISRL